MSPPIAATRTNTTPNSLVTVLIKTRYTKAADTTGWLHVKLEPSGAAAYVPEFVRVEISKEADRTFFLIREGRYKGKMASLSKANASKCLVDVKRGRGAKLVAKMGPGYQTLYSKPRKEANKQLISTLSFGGNSATITLDSDVDYRETNKASPYVGQILHSKPLPKGVYKIMSPEAAMDPSPTEFYRTHPGGNPDLKYDTVWFPIEYAKTYNSNFVHVGNLSEGCVTMYELEKWNALYAYLISNRLDGEGKYVGTITIE
jgi:hypothetical protein